MLCTVSTLVNYINDGKMYAFFSIIMRKALIHFTVLRCSTHHLYLMMCCHSESTDPNNLSEVVIQVGSETAFSLVWLLWSNRMVKVGRDL